MKIFFVHICAILKVLIICFFIVLGGEFLKYMEAFKPFLGIGLKNYAEYQVGHTFIKSTLY